MMTMLATIDVYQNGIKVERVVRYFVQHEVALYAGKGSIIDWHLQPNEVVVYEKGETTPTIARAGL